MCFLLACLGHLPPPAWPCRAGISYALTEAMDEGHCGLPTEALMPLAVKLLDVPDELVKGTITNWLGESEPAWTLLDQTSFSP
jgi:hypothetical protein